MVNVDIGCCILLLGGYCILLTRVRKYKPIRCYVCWGGLVVIFMCGITLLFNCLLHYD